MGMRNKQSLYLASFLAWFSLGIGCAGHDLQHQDEVLPPPGYADAQTAQAMQEGNRLFKERRWRDAEEQYRIAIRSFPSLAEAQYNLGLALHEQGRFSESRAHFTRALKLEPRHAVYRNAPPFRRYGEAPSQSEPEPASDGHGH